jgi:hypothetical protein
LSSATATPQRALAREIWGMWPAMLYGVGRALFWPFGHVFPARRSFDQAQQQAVRGAGENRSPVRLTYQPPVSGTFLLEQTSDPAPAISHQPNEQAAVGS